jgi:hypothetical protein
MSNAFYFCFFHINELKNDVAKNEYGIGNWYCIVKEGYTKQYTEMISKVFKYAWPFLWTNKHALLLIRSPHTDVKVYTHM